MDDPKVQDHVRELNRCNQRGGRMLSLTDLMDAGTIDLDLGAYLAAAMRAGASLLVGASQGGAGKTTVMAALLNWVPNRTRIVPAESRVALKDAYSNPPLDASSQCFVAHEVGSGSYYAYIWGEDARTFFALPRLGFSVATNMHADTLSEAKHQLLRTNGVAPKDLEAVNLKVFLQVSRLHGWEVRRTVSRVYESDGTGDQLIWIGDGHGSFLRRVGSALIDSAAEQKCRQLLAKMQRDDIRSIEQVRGVLVGEN